MTLKPCRVCHGLRRQDSHCGICGAYSLKTKCLVIKGERILRIVRARGAVSQKLTVSNLLHIVEHLRRSAQMAKG